MKVNDKFHLRLWYNGELLKPQCRSTNRQTLYCGGSNIGVCEIRTAYRKVLITKGIQMYKNTVCLNNLHQSTAVSKTVTCTLFSRTTFFTTFFKMKAFMLCLVTAVLAGVFAEPEATADPQNYAKSTYNSYKSNDDYCHPRKAPKCSKNGTLSFCLKDSDYPEKEVKYAIEYDPLILKKYADVAEQSANNLVDGLTSLSEKHFSYSDYHGNTFEKGNWIGDEGYICPSDVLYARPLRAINVEGEWRVIVQDVAWPGYTQTQRIEKCLFPGASCRTLAPCHGSKCLQKYVYQRMLSFDPCNVKKGIFIDIYKLPSSCSCHISNRCKPKRTSPNRLVHQHIGYQKER
ncbi:neurotrophin 1 isoform X4 [Daphnia magna]|uniref:neurotrophin 1 isoform X4 n=1 Tax=Daphnia magna TaxID=35525 RepID=UPI001E1BC6BC|nr:neurotrophin 1 isoform X4 [Daphnia magna]